jgi:CBS domain-containing protein
MHLEYQAYFNFFIRRIAMMNTKVKDIMTPDPELIPPETSIQEAAKLMEKIDCGFLPVGTRNKIEGIITDRDIVVRAIAEGESPKKQTVGYYMTRDVFTCLESDSLTRAADTMRKHQVSRLVVTNQQGNVTGVLSFGCILRKNASAEEISNIIEHAVGKKEHQTKMAS